MSVTWFTYECAVLAKSGQLPPAAVRGWTWSENPAGMHLLIRHTRGRLVRAIAKESSLDLALLSRYRTARVEDDGLFLRFGALSPTSLQTGVDACIGGGKNAER
jgi:hypothetical protein